MLTHIISGMIALVGVLIAGALGFVCTRSTPMISGGLSSDQENQSRRNTDNLVKLATPMIEGKIHAPVYKYDDLGVLPYTNDTGLKRINCHAGQRKLLLTEIEFLTCCAGDSGVIIYAGSAPCEKLPVLLNMFPGKKFLCVDPNYHTFHAPDAKPMIVYQNVDRISSDTIANARKDMRLADRTHLSGEDKKRLQNIRLQDKPVIYKSEYRADMTQPAEPKHAAAMRKIQKNFESEYYKTMFADLVRGDSRVFIIQDYMTESLCKLIATSIQAADSASSSRTRICFISDLRTVFFGPAPIDLDYMWNDAIQLIFLKILRPDWSMLKFHPVYFDLKTSVPLIDEMLSGSTRHQMFPVMLADFKTCREAHGLDFIGNYRAAAESHVYKYLKSSNIWLQAWAPISSSEARLIISKSDIDAPYQSYNARQWDDRFMYSKIMRGYAYYGALYDQIRDIPGHTYDGCYDCAIEMLVLLNYAFRSQAHASDSELNVSRLIEILGTPGAKETLVALQRQIDDVVVYSTTQKCQFHGQLTQPLKMPTFYEHEFSATAPTNQINQVSLSDSVIVRKPVIKYDCRGNSQSDRIKFAPGAKLRLGSNVPEIDAKNKELFAQTGLVFCRGREGKHD